MTFSTKQSLGGHTSRGHPEKTKNKNAKLLARENREMKRATHKLAKDLYQKIQNGGLDPVTQQTFGWKR